MTHRILKILYENKGACVSGEEIAKLLGISRAAVKKHADKLIDLSYPITAVKKSGYMLEYMPDILDIHSINMFLELYGADTPLTFFKSADSTNTQAKKLFYKESEGLVIAEEQTEGRGRRGRNFVSEKGGLYLSYFVKPDNLMPKDAVKAVISAAVAVLLSLKNFGVSAEVKWTNDIFLGGKKICGILCEMLCESERAEYLVQGIGVNLNNNISGEISSIASGIKQSTGKEILRAEFAAQLAENLKKCNELLFSGRFSELLTIYRENCLTIGKKVRVCADTEYYAVARGVDEDGFLIVEADGVLKKVIYGDVSVRVE